jgi:hypothetical protein
LGNSKLTRKRLGFCNGVFRFLSFATLPGFAQVWRGANTKTPVQLVANRQHIPAKSSAKACGSGLFFPYWQPRIVTQIP